MSSFVSSPWVRVFGSAAFFASLSATAFAEPSGGATEVVPTSPPPVEPVPPPPAALAPDAPVEAPAPAEEQGHKVLVLPYQAIYRSVPQERLDQATKLLQSELDRRDGVIVVRGAQAQNAAAPTLEAARKANDDAAKAEAEKRVDDAVSLREAAVAAYEASASAIDKLDEYLLAHHALARAYSLRGEDDRAKERIEIAARMRPTFAPPESDYSRIHRRWTETLARKVPNDPPGDVMVNSALPGAQIEIDGRNLEVAPVLLQKVVPGLHLIRATVEGVPPFASLVRVTSGKRVELVATFSGTAGGDAVGKVTDAIATNTLPAEAVSAAATAGKDSGATFVVFGAMAKAENRYTLHTYVVNVAESKLSALDVASFDLDMLTAESDVLKIVQGAHSRIESFTRPEVAVAKIESKLRPESTVKSVSAAPQLLGSNGPKEVVKKAGPRGPIKSLSGSTIDIKDEEGTE
ncbi:MAG: PEGA domain-containing protein [Deltaproteobacteria bacterium]|nr:PEGA domain-containing protein [Deltaproteobacteria bacterium]